MYRICNLLIYSLASTFCQFFLINIDITILLIFFYLPCTYDEILLPWLYVCINISFSIRTRPYMYLWPIAIFILCIQCFEIYDFYIILIVVELFMKCFNIILDEWFFYLILKIYHNFRKKIITYKNNPNTTLKWNV